MDYTSPLTINLVISSLGSGGAERILTTLANSWAQRGHKVHILTFDDGSKPSFYKLDAGIELKPLSLTSNSMGLLSAVRNNLWRVIKLRLALTEIGTSPIVSFGTETNCLVLLASLRLVPVSV